LEKIYRQPRRGNFVAPSSRAVSLRVSDPFAEHDFARH